MDPSFPPCHYFQWGILRGEPLATVSILSIHSVYNHKCPALMTPGFATKSPQSINALPFLHPQTLSCIFFFFLNAFPWKTINLREWQAPAVACWHDLFLLSKILPFWLLPALPLYWEIIFLIISSAFVPQETPYFSLPVFSCSWRGLENQD